MMLVEKYKPRSLSEFVDNKKALKDLFEAIKKGKKVLVYGPTGVGKTLAVELIAKELKYNILELNSSHMRSKKNLEEAVIPFLSQGTIFGRGKVLLFDELEGMSSKDRGGLKFIQEIIKKTRYPIVLITNDIWSPKLTSLRFALEKIEFKRPSKTEVKAFLRKVAKLEGIKVTDKDLDVIIENNRCDIRACLNDLEAGIFEERVKKDTVFDALRTVFKGEDEDEVKAAFDNVDYINIQDILHWIGENIPREYYHPIERKEAYDAISKADIFYARILRRNYWKLLYHAYVMATVGVMCARRVKREHYVKYSMPYYITKMGKTRFLRAKIDAIKKAFASKTHCSTKKAKDYLWFIKEIYTHNPKEGKSILKELGLNTNAISWIKG